MENLCKEYITLYSNETKNYTKAGTMSYCSLPYNTIYVCIYSVQRLHTDYCLMKLIKKEIEIKFFVSTPTVVFVISIVTREQTSAQLNSLYGERGKKIL